MIRFLKRLFGFETQKPVEGCMFPTDNDAFYGGGYVCKCHKQMGDDFWFLPKGECLYSKGPKS